MDPEPDANRLFAAFKVQVLRLASFATRPLCRITAADLRNDDAFKNEYLSAIHKRKLWDDILMPIVACAAENGRSSF